MLIMDLNGPRSVGDSCAIIPDVLDVAGLLRLSITLSRVRKAALTIPRTWSSCADPAIRKYMQRPEITSMASVYYGSCKHCGADFEQHGPGRRRKFCSQQCQRAWWKQHKDQRNHYTFVCKNCGQEYRTTDVRRDTVCSEECRREWIGKQQHQAALIEKQCLSCGKTFQEISSGSGYCSEGCKERGTPRICKVCGEIFYGHADACYCSRRCRLEAKCVSYEEYMIEKIGDRTYTCQECGKEFIAPYGDKRRKYCSLECSKKHWYKTPAGRREKARQRQARRASKYGNGPVDDIDPHIVFERDGWRCGICSEAVDPSLEFPHPRSASLDHIIPLAEGGPHTWNNVQLAHFICNSHKRDQGGGQLKLDIVDESALRIGASQS